MPDRRTRDRAHAPTSPRSCGSRVRPASTPHSPTVMPIAINCSSSARSTSPGPAAASVWCCRQDSRPITAAPPLRKRLLSDCAVDAIVGIDNHRGVFPIHRSVRFLLVTATSGAPSVRLACRFGLDDAAQLETVDAARSGNPAADGAVDDRSVHVSPALLERISGPDLAIPAFRSDMDLAIVETGGSDVSGAWQRGGLGRGLRA